LLAGAALLVVAAACQGGEERPSPTATGAPSTPPAGAGLSATGTPSRSPTAVASPKATAPPATTPAGGGPTAQTATPQAGAGIELGIDVDTSGNTAASLSTVDTCIEKSSGDPDFDIDIYINNVLAANPVTGFEGYLNFPDSIVSISARNTSMFLNQLQGSTWLDLSEPLPWPTSPRYLSVVDVGTYPATAEAGSGVLARLTLHIAGPGVGTLSLTDDNGNPTWIVYGNDSPAGVYPGVTVAGAIIAVDQPCP